MMKARQCVRSVKNNTIRSLILRSESPYSPGTVPRCTQGRCQRPSHSAHAWHHIELHVSLAHTTKEPLSHARHKVLLHSSQLGHHTQLRHALSPHLAQDWWPQPSLGACFGSHSAQNVPSHTVQVRIGMHPGLRSSYMPHTCLSHMSHGPQRGPRSSSMLMSQDWHGAPSSMRHALDRSSAALLTSFHRSLLFVMRCSGV